MGTGIIWWNFNPQLVLSSLSPLSGTFSKDSIRMPKAVKCAFFFHICFFPFALQKGRLWTAERKWETSLIQRWADDPTPV